MNEHWDLTSLYKDEEGYRRDLERFRGWIPVLETYRGTLSDDAKLCAYFDAQVELEKLVNRLYAYAASKADLDRRNVENVGKENELISLLRRLESATSFFDPEILALGQRHMEEFFARNGSYRLVSVRTGRDTAAGRRPGDGTELRGGCDYGWRKHLCRNAGGEL